MSTDTSTTYRTFWRGTGKGKLSRLAQDGVVGIDPASLPFSDVPLPTVRGRDGEVKELWLADRFGRAYRAADDTHGLLLELSVPADEVNEETAFPSGYETDLVPSLGPDYDAYEESVLAREWAPDYTAQKIPGDWIDGIYEAEEPYSEDLDTDDLAEVTGWDRVPLE